MRRVSASFIRSSAMGGSPKSTATNSRSTSKRPGASGWLTVLSSGHRNLPCAVYVTGRSQTPNRLAPRTALSTRQAGQLGNDEANSAARYEHGAVRRQGTALRLAPGKCKGCKAGRVGHGVDGYDGAGRGVERACHRHGQGRRSFATRPAEAGKVPAHHAARPVRSADAAQELAHRRGGRGPPPDALSPLLAPAFLRRQPDRTRAAL